MSRPMGSRVARFVAPLLMILLLVPYLAACGGTKPAATPPAPAPAPTEPAQTEQPTQTEPEPAATERTITDQAGRTVTIPAKVDRVITTWRPAALLVLAAGGMEKFAAVDTSSQKAEFIANVFPGVKDLPAVGNKKGLNIEQIVASNPDVVFIWSGSDTEPVIKQLETQGISVVVLIPESLEQMTEAVLLLGEIMGTEEQAQAMVDYFDDTLAMIDEKLRDLPVEERVKVYMAGSSGVYSTPTGDMFQHFIIEKAGGVNVAADLKGGFAEVSAEQVVQWNPDVMVSVQYCGDDCSPEAIKANPQLQTIKAVQDGEVHWFPSSMDPWDYPEPRAILGMLWLAKTLYPEQMADVDLLAEVDNFHKTFFGKTFTELGGTLDE